MVKTIQIKQIEKSFPDHSGRPVAIISGISLDINDSDFITIVGANGSGKSTLFNCIAGQLSTDNGYILIGTKDISRETEKKRSSYIGRVLQDPKLGTIGSMTLLENLRLAFLRNQTKSWFRQIDRSFVQMAEEKVSLLNMGLEKQLHKKMEEFSGGQRQALSLIMSVMVQPELLLMDEPTSALDPRSAQKLLEITQALSQKLSFKVLMITHNFKEAISYGNKLIIMREGKILKSFSGKEKAELSADSLYEMI
jgi:putative tryptophan/tyrosine transport system ATP-binding protein